jgi:hypothetical protein
MSEAGDEDIREPDEAYMDILLPDSYPPASSAAATVLRDAELSRRSRTVYTTPCVDRTTAAASSAAAASETMAAALPASAAAAAATTSAGAAAASSTPSSGAQDEPIDLAHEDDYPHPSMPWATRERRAQADYAAAGPSYSFMANGTVAVHHRPDRPPTPIGTDSEVDDMESARGRICRDRLVSSNDKNGADDRLACFVCFNFDPSKSHFINCHAGHVICHTCFVGISRHQGCGVHNPMVKVKCTCSVTYMSFDAPMDGAIGMCVKDMLISCKRCSKQYPIGRHGYNDHDHREKDCPQTKVMCSLFDCGKLVPRGDMERHQREECNRKVACHHCGSQFNRREIDAHHADACISQAGQLVCSNMVACPNGCSFNTHHQPSRRDLAESRKRCQQQQQQQNEGESGARRLRARHEGIAGARPTSASSAAAGGAFSSMAAAAAANSSSPYSRRDQVICSDTLWMAPSDVHRHQAVKCPCRPVKCELCAEDVPFHERDRHLADKRYIGKHMRLMAEQAKRVQGSPVHPFGPGYQRIVRKVITVKPSLPKFSQTVQVANHPVVQSIKLFTEPAEPGQRERDLMMLITCTNSSGGQNVGGWFGYVARMCKRSTPATLDSVNGVDLDTPVNQQFTYPFSRFYMQSGLKNQNVFLFSDEQLSRNVNTQEYYTEAGHAGKVMILLEIYHQCNSADVQAIQAAEHFAQVDAAEEEDHDFLAPEDATYENHGN